MSETGPGNPELGLNPEISTDHMRLLEQHAAELMIHPEDIAATVGESEPLHVWTTGYRNDMYRILIDIPEPGYTGDDREDETKITVRKQLDIEHPLGHYIFEDHTYAFDSKTGYASHKVRTREYDADRKPVMPARPANMTNEEMIIRAAKQVSDEAQLGLTRFTESDYAALDQILNKLTPDDVI